MHCSRNIWQFCTWSIRFIVLTDMCSFWWKKCEPRPKLFLRLDAFSTFRGVHNWFSHMCLILLHEEPENFYKEKRSVAFVTGHLFTFLVVFSLIGLVTTQILICDNQIIWRLKILLRTIVAALLKTKTALFKTKTALFKTKDIKKRPRNISQ